ETFVFHFTQCQQNSRNNQWFVFILYASVVTQIFVKSFCVFQNFFSCFFFRSLLFENVNSIIFVYVFFIEKRKSFNIFQFFVFASFVDENRRNFMSLFVTRNSKSNYLFVSCVF